MMGFIKKNIIALIMNGALVVCLSSSPLVYDGIFHIKHQQTAKYLVPSEEKRDSGQELIVATDLNFNIAHDPGRFYKWVIQGPHGGTTPSGQLVKNGDVIQIKNKELNAFLHSHHRDLRVNRKEDEGYGGKQYEVTRYGGQDGNNNWIFYGPFGPHAYCVLQHQGTGYFLHSHSSKIYTALFYQDFWGLGHEHARLNQVTTYGGRDYNNNWLFEAISIISSEQTKEWESSLTYPGKLSYVHEGRALGGMAAFHQSWKGKNDAFSLKFRAKTITGGDIVIAFSASEVPPAWGTFSSKKERAADGYTLFIGYNGNQESMILRGDKTGKTEILWEKQASEDAKVVVKNKDDFDDYWVTFADGILAWGRGRDLDKNKLGEAKDPYPLRGVSFIGFGGGENHVEFKDIVIGQLEGKPEDKKSPVKKKKKYKVILEEKKEEDE